MPSSTERSHNNIRKQLRGDLLQQTGYSLLPGIRLAFFAFHLRFSDLLEAKYVDGVLCIDIAKIEEAKMQYRRIEIKYCILIYTNK